MNLAAKCFSQSNHRGPAEINSGDALTREMQCKQAEPEIMYMDEDLPGFGNILTSFLLVFPKVLRFLTV